MTDMTDMTETTVWLSLEPQFRAQRVVGMRVAKMTKGRPMDAVVAVQLKLRLPKRAFAPLAPTVTIEVPEDALSWPEPEITVETDS